MLLCSVSSSDVRHHWRLRGDPSFIFDAAPIDHGVFPVLEKYFQSRDFVGARLLNADSNLRTKIDRTHQVQLANDLPGHGRGGA